MQENTWYNLDDSSQKNLLDLLLLHKITSLDEASAIVHSLVDIATSIERIYSIIIPKILDNSDSSFDILKDQLWDLREEFRHIDYHIRDAKLTEL